MDWEFSFNTELFLIQSENGHESQPSGILKRHSQYYKALHIELD